MYVCHKVSALKKLFRCACMYYVEFRVSTWGLIWVVWKQKFKAYVLQETEIILMQNQVWVRLEFGILLGWTDDDWHDENIHTYVAMSNEIG